MHDLLNGYTVWDCEKGFEFYALLCTRVHLCGFWFFNEKKQANLKFWYAAQIADVPGVRKGQNAFLLL